MRLLLNPSNHQELLREVAFRSQSWEPSPGRAAALIAEPYDQAIEQRECDLQLWQHWADVQDGSSAQGSSRPQGSTSGGATAQLLPRSLGIQS